MLDHFLTSSTSPSGTNDSAAEFSADTYLNTTDLGGKVTVRALLIEDRIITVDQKFFCDRATEKTVTLNVIN